MIEHINDDKITIFSLVFIFLLNNGNNNKLNIIKICILLLYKFFAKQMKQFNNFVNMFTFAFVYENRFINM